jgi:hypothetical protein
VNPRQERRLLRSHGPLVSRDEVGDLRDGLQVITRVNGTEVQPAIAFNLEVKRS